MSRTREPEPVPTLADLIQRHQAQTGDSYSDIARKTGLSKSKVGQLARPESNSLVRAETLEKIAHGLHMPLATVQRSALGTAGYSDRETQAETTLGRIIERLEEMDEPSLLLIEGIVEAVAKNQ